MGYFDSDHPTFLAEPVGPADHVRGPATAAVTLVEYGDFACPYCGAAYQNIKALLARFPQDLRLVFRVNPRSHVFPHAAEAAEAAEAAAAQGKFWEMHDLLFENQSTLSSEEIRGHAARLGLDMSRFGAELEGGVHKPAVRAQEISGWHSHVLSTPTFFINGVRFDNAVGELASAVAHALRQEQRIREVFREVRVQGGDAGFRQTITVGSHQLTSDLPAGEGGGDAGPGPHDLLLSALGACTSMTIKWAAQRDRMPLSGVEVRLSQSRTKEGHLFRRSIELHGELSGEQRDKLLQAAERCPVARTLGGHIDIHTRLVDDHIVDEAGAESFPASDPPSWTLGR